MDVQLVALNVGPGSRWCSTLVVVLDGLDAEEPEPRSTVSSR
jgi:hypothetical protein